MQHTVFNIKDTWGETGLSDIGLHNRLHHLNIMLDLKTGHLAYTPYFTPLKLHYDLIFVRHGETFGNCGQSTINGELDHESIAQNLKDKNKRIYQGSNDTAINQLTELGHAQSKQAATQLKIEFLQKNWQPDLVFSSPLMRAQATAKPFVDENTLHSIFYVHPGLREIAFGAWGNRRICDFSPIHPCHTFYLQQNALVKQTGLDVHHQLQIGENFCEVILRAYDVLNQLNEQYAGKKIVMFSHSMFGAACKILLGNGSKRSEKNYLVFDDYQNAVGCSIPHAHPVVLNMIN